MWKALKEEIKHTIGGSAFHVVRFFIILLVPFILGITTYTAFANPFDKGKNLQMTVVVDNDDVLGNQIAKEIAKEKEVRVGDLMIPLNFDVTQVEDITAVSSDIYKENQLVVKLEGPHGEMIDELVNVQTDDVAHPGIANNRPTDANPASINHYPFNDMTISEMIGVLDWAANYQPYRSNDANGLPAYSNTAGNIESTFYMLEDIANMISNSITIINNYNMDYFVAFGIDKSIIDGELFQNILIDSFNAIQSFEYFEYLISESVIMENDQVATVADKDGLTYQNFTDFFSGYVSGINGVKDVNNTVFDSTADLGKLAGFGYGVAPIIIAGSIWIGAVAMVFIFRRRVYENQASPTKRYFAKSIVMATCVFIQVTILMLSLTWIGFAQVGWGHWGGMYGFAILFGILITEIIQAINVIVPSKSAGFLIVLMLTALQLTMSGGLFPMSTQSQGLSIFNQMFPLSHVTSVFRELSFNTNWGQVGIDIALILPWLLLIPIAMYIENKRDKKFVAQHSFAIKGRTMFHIGGKGGTEW